MNSDREAKYGLTEYGLKQARFNFGLVMWKILEKNKKVDYVDAARKLGISQEYLRSLLHGQADISQQMIDDKNWRAILLREYPETWKENSPAFEKCIRVFDVQARKEPHYGEPEDKNSLGYVLWLILGGENANMREAAQRLNISPSHLSNIVHGRAILDKTMRQKGWRETFAKYYAETWNEYEPVFEERAAKLPKELKNKSNEPEDKDSFGYVLWLILGGEDAHIKKSAELLNIHHSYLSAIIHNRQTISPKTIDKKRWRETFAKDYPETWKEYAPLFEELVNKQGNSHEGSLTAHKPQRVTKSLPPKSQIKGLSFS